MNVGTYAWKHMNEDIGIKPYEPKDKNENIWMKTYEYKTYEYIWIFMRIYGWMHVNKTYDYENTWMKTYEWKEINENRWILKNMTQNIWMRTHE